MRVVLLGDLQAGAGMKRYAETNEKGVNLRLLDTVAELDRIRLLCVNHKVEAVCILGDIFDARNTLDISVLNHLYRAFRQYVDSGLRLILVIGNHDRCDVGREHALEIFKSFCDVVDTPRVLALRDGTLLAIPFHPNPQAVTKAIKKHVTADTKLLLLHTAVREVLLPSGKQWNDGITLGDIPEHCITVMGHFHRWREVRQGNVYYVGSLGHVDRGDEGIEKYFAVYDSVKHQVTFPVAKGPRFVTIDVPFMPGRHFADGEYSEKEFQTVFTPKVRGNFVMVKSIPPNWHDTGAIERALLQLGARHVDMAFHTELPITPPERLTQTTEIPVAEEVITQYVAATQTDLDKDSLIDTAMEIVTEVLETGQDTGDEIIVEVGE